MSNERKELVFCGSGKTHTFNDGNKVLNLFVCLDDIPDEHTFTTRNEKKCVRLNIRRRKEPDAQGNEFFVVVDTYKIQQSATPQNSGNDPF